MYFTELPSLNSIEAIMKQPPGVSQRGGGRKRSSHKYNKKDCDCRFCLEHSNDGCTADICPVLDIRLSCGAASFREAVQAIFAGARHIPFQKRLSKIYDRKDDKPVVFQNEQHQRIFEAQRKNLRKPDNQALAVGGDDSYGNLQIIHIDVHKLIHAKDKEEIQRLLESLQLTEFQIERVNLLRNRCNLFPI